MLCISSGSSLSMEYKDSFVGVLDSLLYWTLRLYFFNNCSSNFFWKYFLPYCFAYEPISDYWPCGSLFFETSIAVRSARLVPSAFPIILLRISFFISFLMLIYFLRISYAFWSSVPRTVITPSLNSELTSELTWRAESGSLPCSCSFSLISAAILWYRYNIRTETRVISGLSFGIYWPSLRDSLRIFEFEF